MSTEQSFDPFVRYGTDERDYLLKRAEDHRRLAEESGESEQRAVHLRFQQLYQQQAALVPMVLPD